MDPERLLTYFSAQTNWTESWFSDVYLPGEYVEPYLTRYFDVDVEHLRAYEQYDPEKGAYRLPEQPHGYNDVITDAAMDGDVLVITYQRSVIPERGTKVTMDGNIRVITYDDEARSKEQYQKGELRIWIDSYPRSFKYLSNEVFE